MTPHGFLWSGLDAEQWLAMVAAQTAVGFAILAAIITPAVGWARRVYRRATDPYTPGGAGDRPAPDGQSMHDYLATLDNDRTDC